MTEFLRARRPDQKTVRRIALLDAARELFDDGGAAGAGLNAIAARAGFTKSNVYRYFESREHVLLELFLDEFDEFARALRSEIEGLSDGDVTGIADAIARAFIARERLCKLVAIFGSVLEQNVSVAAIAAVKASLAEMTLPLVLVLSGRLPQATREDCGWFFAMMSSLLAGMWPGVRPSPAAAEVLAQEQFANMVLTLERDFRRAVVALLTSIAN